MAQAKAGGGLAAMMGGMGGGGKDAPPHGLWMLVGLEVAALWLIRRSFRSSHGG